MKTIEEIKFKIEELEKQKKQALLQLKIYDGEIEILKWVLNENKYSIY